MVGTSECTRHALNLTLRLTDRSEPKIKTLYNNMTRTGGMISLKH